MFKRRDAFRMTIDFEVDYEWIDLQGLEHPRPLAESQGIAVNALIQAVYRIANDVLRERGQKIKTHAADIDGALATVSIRFRGKRAAATDAYGEWCETVAGLGPVARILRARLGGSDGWFDEYTDLELQSECELLLSERCAPEASSRGDRPQPTNMAALGDSRSTRLAEGVPGHRERVNRISGAVGGR